MTVACLLVVAAGLPLRAASAADKAKKAADSEPKADAKHPKPLIMDDLLLLPDADPPGGSAPLKVKFTGTIYDDDVVEPKFTWDFGDGSGLSHERNPTHVYKREGIYTVTVSVIDYWKRKGKDEFKIPVDAPARK